MESSLKYQCLELIIRLFCGIIFLFQGYDKLFVVKIKGVVSLFQRDASSKNVPSFIQYGVAFYTSVMEFFGGILLILGLFKNIILVLLGFDVIMVAVAFSVLEPVWDMRHVFPRLLIVSVLLVMPDDWSRFTIDNLLSK
ncbi:MAG TPA: DoxX family protein [Bacteroidia bacterium]|nr:DoxX family protein [Bacteroidia bacterium]